MAGHIFISYSKRDSGFAFKLADSLTEAGRKVWIDRQIEAGERWRSSISQALRECSEAIVILSPRSVASEWVMHEGSVASGLEKPIYPVLMEPVNKLPIWMEELQFIDFHNKSYEDAFDQLIKALTPPNPLQDVLDQQVKAHQQTGELIGEALLRVIDEHYSSLTVSADAAELIARSKKAIAYRRRLVRGSAALAGILSIIALLAGLAAIRSGADIARAQFQLNTAQAEMALAQTGLDRAEAEAATAQAQQASAQEGYEIALTQQAVVQDALATATVAVGAAEQQLGDTQARLESAETQLARLFETTGTVPVSDQPRDLAYAGASLWVANADKTLAKIDTATGIATQTLTLSSSPAALAWDGEALWAAYRDSRLIERIDPQTGRVLATVTGGDGTTALVWTGDRLCVTDRRANTLQCMLPPTDGTNWTAEAPINVGQDPRAMVADGSGLLWVANRAV